MPYIPRALNLAPNTDGDPTYRSAMLPFATYANPDGSGEHFGFAVPGAIQEPLNALSRLFGTPSHPGTFGQGPDAPGNAEDMRTLLLSLYGGNALNPAAVIPKGALASNALRVSPLEWDGLSNGVRLGSKSVHTPEGKLASYADITQRPEGIELSNITTFPEYRGQGYAKSLVDDLLREADGTPVTLSPLTEDGRVFFGKNYPDLLSDTGKPSLFGEGNTPIRGYRGSNQARPIDAPRSRYWASTSPEVASGYATSPYGFDAPNVTPANFSFENPMTVDAGGSYWAQIPHNGGTTTTDNLARLAEANGHDGLIVRNVLDEMAGNGMSADSILALKRGTVTSPLTGETLFSDTGKPSLMGSAIAGAEGNVPVRAYRGKPDAEQLFPEPLSPANRRLMLQTGNPEMVWGSSSPDVAGTYAGIFDHGLGVSSDDLSSPLVGAMAPMDLRFENPMRVDAQGMSWNNIPNPNGGRVPVTTDTLASVALQRGHDGLIVNNVLDRAGGKIGEPSTTYAALRRGTVTSPLTGEVLFSDTGKPSIMGSAVAGAEVNQPVRAFHSTDAQFDRFDPAFTDEVGFHFGNKDQAQTRQMVKGGITSFINPWSDWRTIPVNIETQNPAALSRDVQHFTGERVANQLVRDGIAPPSLLDDIAGAAPEQQTKYVRDWLVANGYDAVKYPNDFEGAGAPSYMALGTGNVKHARTGDVLFAGAPPVVTTSNNQDQPLSLADLALIAGNR